MISTSSKPHAKARWQWPDAYSSGIASPLKRPRLMFLRSSCGHVLGAGTVWKRQRFIAWKTCR